MTKAIALLSVLTASFGITIGTLILGWGLKPCSWTWIVIFWFLSMILLGVMDVIRKEK